MTADIKGFLLEIGNIVLNDFLDDKVFRELPTNSWLLNFSVIDTTLNFTIMLQYEVLLKNNLYMLADPFFGYRALHFELELF